MGQLERVRAGRYVREGELEPAAGTGRVQRHARTTARRRIRVGRGGNAARRAAEAFGFPGQRRRDGTYGVGRRAHRAVARATGIRNGFERGGRADGYRPRVERARGRAGCAAVSRVTDRSAARRRDNAHRLRAAIRACTWAERRRRNRAAAAAALAALPEVDVVPGRGDRSLPGIHTIRAALVINRGLPTRVGLLQHAVNIDFAGVLAHVRDRVDADRRTDGERAADREGVTAVDRQHHPWAAIYVEGLFDTNIGAAKAGHGEVTLKLMGAGSILKVFALRPILRAGAGRGNRERVSIDFAATGLLDFERLVGRRPAAADLSVSGQGCSADQGERGKFIQGESFHTHSNYGEGLMTSDRGAVCGGGKLG